MKEMNPTERTEYYLEKIFWPFIAALAVIVLSYIAQNNVPFLSIAAHGMLSIVIASRTYRAHLHWRAASAVGGICGALLGFASGLTPTILDFSVVRLFAIIPTVFIGAAANALLSGFIVEALYSFKRMEAKRRNK